ncbi:NB-ARC - like 10 [Theobroma cacao]|nr:NB-ARC - like 10 [Theobroma cacao]
MNSCKIFLTTHLKQVCTRLKCQKEVQLNILSEHEVWALFKGNAGLKDVTSPFNDVAREVAGECKGLPLAIVTLGRALKDETLDVYQRLKDSRHIENQDVYGEDRDIRIEELTIYRIRQGMFDDARRAMRVIIKNLQKSSLLLKTNNERRVKMHAVVRDFVYWMTSRGKNTVMVKSGLKQ